MYMNNLLSACFAQEEGVSVAYVIGFTTHSVWSRLLNYNYLHDPTCMVLYYKLFISQNLAVEGNWTVQSLPVLPSASEETTRISSRTCLSSISPRLPRLEDRAIDNIAILYYL